MFSVSNALYFARGIVRPALAIGFAAAQIGLAAVWATQESAESFAPFAGLMPITLIVVKDYFDSRPNRKESD